VPESYTEEHVRLIAEVEHLRRDHDDIHRRPFNVAEHRAHLVRLQAVIAALKAHRRREIAPVFSDV